eukprot:7814463-Heterocapsa_arctica.AAC.1
MGSPGVAASIGGLSSSMTIGRGSKGQEEEGAVAGKNGPQRRKKKWSRTPKITLKAEATKTGRMAASRGPVRKPTFAGGQARMGAAKGH